MSEERARPDVGMLVGILRDEGMPLAPWARYGLAAAIFGAALAARFLLLPLEGGLAFLTFYPATMLAALLCGSGPGLMTVLLGAVAGPYVFMAPHWSFAKFEYRHLLPATVFVFSGFIVNFLAHQMRCRTEEARAANRQLAATMEDLKRSNQELDEFAYVASHDLKEPLRGLHNYASFLQEDYADRLDADGRHYLERMQRLAERLANLIDCLLAYSRVGTAELKLDAVDLEHLVDGVVEDLKPFLADHGVELARGARLPAAVCNATRVGEVFQNLIVNGAKYNDNPAKRIEIGCLDASPAVFFVRDDGIGIPAQHQDNVFRIFKRLHEQDKYGGGSGAGLTIVKKIVERHGGRIWLESTPGEGSTFYFTLAAEC